MKTHRVRTGSGAAAEAQGAREVPSLVAVGEKNLHHLNLAK